MINGEIDLSIGALYLFTPFICYKLSQNVGLPLIPALIGSLVARDDRRYSTGSSSRSWGSRRSSRRWGCCSRSTGLTLVISHATPVVSPGTNAVTVPTFAQIFGAGTYSELFWAIGIVIILQIVLSFTRWGIYTVSVGGNRLGAAEAGIRVSA